MHSCGVVCEVVGTGALRMGIAHERRASESEIFMLLSCAAESQGFACRLTTMRKCQQGLIVVVVACANRVYCALETE